MSDIIQPGRGQPKSGLIFSRTKEAIFHISFFLFYKRLCAFDHHKLLQYIHVMKVKAESRECHKKVPKDVRGGLKFHGARKEFLRSLPAYFNNSSTFLQTASVLVVRGWKRVGKEGQLLLGLGLTRCRLPRGGGGEGGREREMRLRRQRQK